mgnify:CR=1 FL=1
MEIIWNGHSCFTVKTSQGNVVLDPYEDGKVPGLEPLHLEADLVLCSHEHQDHNYRAAVKLSGKPCGLTVTEIASWHDDSCGTKRGSNTIHVIEAEGMKLVHLGDLGTALNTEQIDALKAPDVLLIPIGGYYTIDSDQALKIISQLQPRITIPMHFRRGAQGYDVISTADAFLGKCSNRVEYPANSLTVDRDTPAQTAVLYV